MAAWIDVYFVQLSQIVELEEHSSHSESLHRTQTAISIACLGPHYLSALSSKQTSKTTTKESPEPNPTQRTF
jgi:hypothetical protein